MAQGRASPAIALRCYASGEAARLSIERDGFESRTARHCTPRRATVTKWCLFARCRFSFHADTAACCTPWHPWQGKAAGWQPAEFLYNVIETPTMGVWQAG